MKINLVNIIIPIAFLATSGVTDATVLFSDDFNSYTAGDPITIGSSPIKWASVRPTGNPPATTEAFFTAELDSSNFFGEGTANQYADMSLTDAVGNENNILISTNAFSGSETGQFSMEFYDPSSASNSGTGWSLRLGTGAGNSATIFGVFLDDGDLILSGGSGVVPNGGTIATYTQDAVHTLDIVFNNSSSNLNYAGGIVASQRMDVYLNGILVGDDLANSGGTGVGTNISAFNFTGKTDTSFTNSLYINRIVVDNSPTIPETSNYASIAGLLTLMLVWLRCRSHA